jgi:transcriptional regulator with PAS, ATPase and Fis domain
VAINCAAIPDQLLESELFGHVKGSFTGAVSHKEGLFEVADQGSIFLDEVAELSLPLQVKLLRVLADRSFRRVGGVEDIQVDVRVIAASNRSLEEAVSKGTFREDLYYRLKVIGITVPPLRERKEDIPLLCQHFLEKFAKQSNRPLPQIREDTMEILQSYPWPGNVRELENVMERAVALEASSQITPQSLPFDPGLLPEVQVDVGVSQFAFLVGGGELSTLEELERRYIGYALGRLSGNYTRTAQALGISLSTLKRKVRLYGLYAESKSTADAK